jgi:uncharacterized membrane protein HdeD (DUF308 family)
MQPQIDVFVLQVPQEVARGWGWVLALGIALIVLGALAVARSTRATVISMYFFGWLLLLAAAVEVAHAMLVGRWGGFFLHLLGAILSAVLAVLLLRHPTAGAQVITLVMVMYFLVIGLFQIVAPLVMRLPSWHWPVLDGIVTLVLGLLILAGWPVSGLWVIGLFIGINLIVRGLDWVLFALDLRAM